MYSRLTGEGEQDITRVQLVSGEYFTLLGLAPEGDASWALRIISRSGSIR